MQKDVIEYLDKASEQYPNKICYSDEKHSYSFFDVDKFSKQIAFNLLDENNVRKPIIIFMDKNCNALLSMWGAMRSGNFYVIIDTTFPIERINSMVDVLSTEIIITDRVNLDLIVKSAYCGKILVFEDMIGKPITENDLIVLKNTQHQICDIDPAYAMFTSGSTGIPKCVVVSHKSVIDFIDNFTEVFNIHNTDIFANQAPFDFDVSVKDIFSCMKVGATLNIIPKKYFTFPKQLADFLEDRNVNVLVWAVSALCILSGRSVFEYKIPSKINKVIFSGEVMPTKQLKIWMKHYPNAMFVNVYGPTEITCNCTYYIIDNNKVDIDKPIPIGKTFPNKRVILIDETGNLISKPNTNTIGEICVLGSCLALGYYGHVEKTEEVFVRNPFLKLNNELMYRTGDLAYYDENYDLCYKGRKDFQIKYMGHRIELLEIDKAINNINGVNAVCTFFDKDTEKIISFFSGEVGKKDIIKDLVNRLPKFMIPTEIIKKESLPLNKNGKIDRSILINDYLKGIYNT